MKPITEEIGEIQAEIQRLTRESQEKRRLALDCLSSRSEYLAEAQKNRGDENFYHQRSNTHGKWRADIAFAKAQEDLRVGFQARYRARAAESRAQYAVSRAQDLNREADRLEQRVLWLNQRIQEQLAELITAITEKK